MLIKGIVINLIVLVLYCALITLNSEDANKGFNIAVGAGICIVLHVGLNVIAGVLLLVMSKRELAKSLLISAAILAPVGFCAWLLLLSIYG